MRRANDFYPTPGAATAILLNNAKHLFLDRAHAYEPCAGDGAIARVLKNAGLVVTTNDIAPSRRADSHLDAAKMEIMPFESCVITNPPFNQALPIVRNFVEQGHPCAFLLRLSFLEPTEARGGWLAENPPDRLIILPRISFTGDGKTDSVTCAWMIWNTPDEQGIIVVTKQEMAKFDFI